MSKRTLVNNIPPTSGPPDSVEALDLLTAKFVADSKLLQSQLLKLLIAIAVTAFLSENYEQKKFTAVTENLTFFQRETCDNKYAKFITENVNGVCKNVKSVKKVITQSTTYYKLQSPNTMFLAVWRVILKNAGMKKQFIKLWKIENLI